MDATTVESIIAMPLGAASNSNTNMSCGSSSSSNSSGYASATTPTNPASAGSSSSHSQYSDSHSNTPVGLVEPTPVATIAAVTPYYNETFQQQHHQQQQQHQPQLHHPPHPQYPHQTHSYQLTEPLPTSSQYDNTYDSYTYLSGGESYQQSSGGSERNLLGMRHATSHYTTLEKPSKQPTQTAIQPHTNTAKSNKIYNNNSSETALRSTKRIGESNTAAKPQAAATPFYANSLQTGGSGTYGDPIKYRMSTGTKLPTLGDYLNYGNQPLDISNTGNYTQSFPQHHAGKPLQDVPYGASPTQVKTFNNMPNTRLPQQRLSMHYGNTAMPVGIPIGNASNNSNGSNSSSSIYIDKYDKYLYNAVSTVAQSPYYTTTPPANLSAMPYNAVPYAPAPPASTSVPPQYAAEIPNDAYRKSSATSAWHWSMDYSNGNCRTLPPPNGIPTAAIPPTNASYVPTNATAAANRDIYYSAEKYSNKYDKYNSYYNPHQQYMTSNATGRSAWSNSPHSSAHLVPTLAERLSHPYPHHAPLTTGGVPTALAPSAHPSLAYHHPYTPSAATATARQNCCSQFQQQNCYYPRTAHHPHLPPNTYSPHSQTPPYGTSSTAVGSGNSPVIKYNVLDYGPANKSKVNTNDVYAATPAYEATNMNYHSHPAGMAHNAQYGNAMAPTTVVAHPPLNRNMTPGSHNDITTVYYNDLNMQTNYDNYMGPIQPTPLVEERRESLVQRVDHLPNLPPPYTQSTSTKNSLIDYRKPAVTPNDDSFIAEPTLTNLDEHMATNMSQNQYDNSYGLTRALEPIDDGMYGKATTRESTVKPGNPTPTTPTTKTYSSLRDFLSTWNEDEEDYGGADELQFVENAPPAIDQVMRAENNTNCVEVINKMSSLQELPTEANTPAAYVGDSAPLYRAQPQPLVINNLQLKEDYYQHPKTQPSIGAGSTVNMEESQYANINLPDIVIDIEKSGGGAPNISGATKAPSNNNVVEKSNDKDVSYDCFDVEKELDELESIKMVKIPKINTDTTPIRNGSVIMKAATEALGVVTPNAMLESENLEIIASLKAVNTPAVQKMAEKVEKDFCFSEHRAEQSLLTVQAKSDSTFDRSIECDNTTSSNGSTFEKEYETFINKIGNEFEYKVNSNNENNFTAAVSNKLVHSDINTNVAVNQEVPTNEINNTAVKLNTESDMEIAQKIKSFSKFHKRKRKFSETTNNASKIPKQSHDLEQEVNKETNFIETFSKPCRKKDYNVRLHTLRLKYIKKRENKGPSFYQRRIRALYHHFVKINKRLIISSLLREEMVKVSQKHLPLIDRINSTTLPTRDGSDIKQYFNPKTLKFLCVAFINSELFQNKLLKGVEISKEIDKIPETNINEESVRDSPIPQEVKDCEAKENTINEVCNKITCPPSLSSFVAENIFEENVRNEVSDRTSEIDESEYSKQLSEEPPIAELGLESIEVTQNDVNLKNHIDFDMPTTLDVKDSKMELDSIETDEIEKEVHSPDCITEPMVHSVETNAESINTRPKYDDKHDRSVDRMEIKEIESEAYDGDISGDGEIVATKLLTKDIDKPFSDLNTSVNMMDILENQWICNESVENRVPDVENLACLTKDLVNQVIPPNDSEDHVNEITENTRQKATVTDLVHENVENRELEAMDLTCSAGVEENSIHNQKTEVPECAISVPQNEITLSEFSGPCSNMDLEDAFKVAEYPSRIDGSPLSVMEVAESPPTTPHMGSPVHMKSENSNDTDIIMLNAFDLGEQAKQPNHFSRNVDLSETENSLDMFGARRSAEHFTTTSKNYFTTNMDLDENSSDSNSSSSADSSTSSSSRRSSTSSSSSSSSSTDENSQSSLTTVQSDFNEMKELERELSQHQANEAGISIELENGEKTAVATNIEDNSGNEVYINSSKTITENDIKTLKKILESDSDGHEEISTNREDVKAELENGEKTAAATNIEDNSGNEVFINSSKTITENDIKTLKKILESDSDGHEEISANLEDVKADTIDVEKLSADKTTSVSKEQQTDTVNGVAEDNKLMQNEDCVASNGEVNVTMPTAERDCIGTEVVEECVESCEKSCDVEGLARELAVDEDQPQNEPVFCAAINIDDNDDDSSGVPSLKKLSLDYIERVTSIENHTLNNRTEDALNSKIPKLSDLCKIALSSSFEISANNNSNNNTNQNTPEALERELSVEEALAEMYRQAGVTSDPEDGDAEEREAQDVVLINLEEILVNDSDLYVLQCDMNENVLSVVAHAQASDLPMQVDEGVEDIERTVNAEMHAEEMMGLESPQEEVVVTDDMQTDYLESLVNVHDAVDNSPSALPLTPYITPPHTVEYVEDELRITNDDSLNTQFDFPAIHHEEIVSHDYKRLKRQAPPW
ncbi:uncharacterized protein LOC126753889 isoform X2 [Bactrocera neohumeralis]|uniref:uncharacterized protein LOC126753889 isoform X2 n=1 Tax=Bactrocera neohumeralis TaxID=98809 RepID=UPI0021662BEE|nr:uncharacterized protein LOC126753889 isoform X2 [Bactrocera neohumeralis]